MTVQELFDVLEQAIYDGHANTEVLFDSEAVKFDVHMVSLESAHINDEDEYNPFISLHFTRNTPVRRIK